MRFMNRVALITAAANGNSVALSGGTIPAEGMVGPVIACGAVLPPEAMADLVDLLV